MRMWAREISICTFDLKGSQVERNSAIKHMDHIVESKMCREICWCERRMRVGIEHQSIQSRGLWRTKNYPHWCWSSDFTNLTKDLNESTHISPFQMNHLPNINKNRWDRLQQTVFTPFHSLFVEKMKNISIIYLIFRSRQNELNSTHQQLFPYHEALPAIQFGYSCDQITQFWMEINFSCVIDEIVKENGNERIFTRKSSDLY